MKRIFILILALLMPFGVYAGKPMMTEQEFTLGFIERLKVSIPDSKFEIVSNLRIHTKDIDGYELNIFLDNAYDVAVFVANWPAKRAEHWKTLLKARAIENLSYVIGVNRVGTDGNGLTYSGDSTVIDPVGNTLFTIHNQPALRTATLSGEILENWRRDFPAWMDADHDILSLPDTDACSRC